MVFGYLASFHFPEKFPPQNYVQPEQKLGGWKGEDETHGVSHGVFPLPFSGFFRLDPRCQLLTLGAGNAWALQRSTSILVRETRWGSSKVIPEWGGEDWEDFLRKVRVTYLCEHIGNFGYLYNACSFDI